MKKKVKFIAEVCSNHNQSLKRCIKFIKTSKQIGCYAIKFQLFKIEGLFADEILKKSKSHRLRKKFELPEKFIKQIYHECKKQKIKFGCTPFDLDAVDKLSNYVDFFKISSYEILWDDLLIKCAKSKKPIIFSTGMANEKEIKHAYNVLKRNGAKKITVLNCISEYPAGINNLNLQFFDYLKQKISHSYGWSDHTKNPIFLSHIINNYDLDFIEFHIDLDKKGYEYNDGHCWLPNEIAPVIEYKNFLNKKKSYLKKNIRNISKTEKFERSWRADPIDGLRPFKKVRKKF